MTSSPTPAPVACSQSAVTASRLQAVLAQAGWHLERIDMDLTGDTPQVQIDAHHADGRVVFAFGDSVGRSSLETFQRTRRMSISRSIRAGQPLSRSIEDTFLGRIQFDDPRSLVGFLIEYMAMDSDQPAVLAEMRAAWALAMGAPQQLDLLA